MGYMNRFIVSTHNLEMFRSLKKSRHGHKVCRPQILSVFVCLQYKCKSRWRCPTLGFVCFYIRTPRGGNRRGRSKFRYYKRINEQHGAAAGTSVGSSYFWNVSATLKLDFIDFHQYSKDQWWASWNSGAQKGARINTVYMHILYIQTLALQE